MSNLKIATSAEQPINRFGAEVAEEVEEGDFVALEDVDDDGEPEYVKADVTDDKPAVGVAIKAVRDPENMSYELQGMARDIVEVEEDTVGDRLAAIRYGVEVEDTEADFDVYEGHYGEPVYLTQGKDEADSAVLPESEADDVLGSGDVWQAVGYVSEERRVGLEVDKKYDTVE